MRKQNFDTKQHFSIRKLTIGAASVLIGTSFYLAGGNIAHADTVPVSDTHTALDKAANETNGVSNEAPSSASAAQSVTDSQAPESNTANDVNTSNVQSKASNSVAPNAVPASSSAATDSSNAGTYPAPNVADWSTITNDQGLEITDYIGQKTDAITIPNTADFVKAGKLQDGQKAEISSLTMRKLVDNGTTKNLKISDTDNAKLYAKDSDWSYTFSVGGLDGIGFMYQEPNDTSDLQNFEYPSKQRVDQINQVDTEIPGGEHSNIELENLDLDNLDTSNITNMFAMFATLDTAKSISLKNWDTSNVTNMGFMFINNNSLTHLDGIENFDTSNVTSMDEMFVNTFNLKTSLDLSHWDTSKVKTFYQMFLNSSIPVLNISNWDFTTAQAYSKQYPDSSITPNSLLYGSTSGNAQSDMANFNLIAGNVKGSASYGNPLTVSNSKNLYLINNDLQDYSKHIFYLVNNKGETLTAAISIPVQIYANVTNAKDAKNAALTWINQQLNKYLMGEHDNISDNNVGQFLKDHHGDTLIFDEIINTKIPRNLLNCETTQDSNSDQDYATGAIDLAGDAEGESGLTQEQIDALYQPTFYLNGDKSDLPNVKTTFSELTKYLQDFFGDDGSKLMLIDSANDQDFPDKPLTAAENGTIVATDRYVDVTKDYENDSDVSTATKWTVSETINVTDPKGNKTVPVNKSITFTRTATKDNLIDKVTYGDWNKQSDTFDAYEAPTYAGYTPSMAEVSAQTVKPGDKDLVFNITYAPDTQKAIVKFINQDNQNSVVKSVSINGISDEKSTYTTKNDIDELENNGYTVISDPTKGSPITFDHDDKTDQIITVVLSRPMKFTINVVDADDNNKIIMSQNFNNWGNGGYTRLSIPNSANYYSAGSSTIDGVTFKASYWVDFSNPSSNWTIPNVKWEKDAADNLYGKTLVIYVKHVMTGIPDGTKLSDKDLDGYKEQYDFTYDVVYQGNIPDNIKPSNIHKVVTWTHEVDAQGNIGYRDSVTGKVQLNDWHHNKVDAPAIATPNLMAADGSIYKPTIMVYKIYDTSNPKYVFNPDDVPDYTDEQTDGNYKLFGFKLDSIPDLTSILDESLPYDIYLGEDTQGDMGGEMFGYSGVKVVVTYNSTPAILNINYIDDKTGETITTNKFDGNVGQKVTQNNLPVPDGYYLISSKIPDALIDGENIATVTVVKKETSNGDVDTHELATKNIIIYKDKDGNVIGTEDMTGKPGDKVTPNIPEGYFNGDVTEVTIPENGIAEVTVVKKETSNGDVANTDALPTKNVIVYKDGNGDVVGIQEITGNKVTPTIPEGYFNGDITEVTIPESGIVTVNVVKKETSNGDVANTDALPTKNIIIYKDGNGDVVGTQKITGRTGDKVTPTIPEGYFNGDTTEVTIPESGIAEVTVVKKETSNGDVANTDSLPTKNVIIYKDGNGDVVGTQEITGKTGDKVTPTIPEGYFNGDITEVTIPENGIAEVTVVKKESSSGDPLVQPELPTYTAPNVNVPTPDMPNNAPTQDGTDAGDKDTDTQKKPSVDRPDVDKPNVNKPSRGPVITKDTTPGAMSSSRIRNDINQGPLALNNIKQTKQKPSVKIADNNANAKQSTLPQTGENSNVFAVIAGSLATVLGLFVLAKYKKRD